MVVEEVEQMRTKRPVVGVASLEFSGMDIPARESSGITALVVDVALFSQELSVDAAGNGSGSNVG
jgi:hypothetical protein